MDTVSVEILLVNMLNTAEGTGHQMFDH